MTNEKINLAMRSLFRYLELNKLKSSTIIIENEANILKKRFRELEPEELKYLFSNWESYYDTEVINQEYKDQLIIDDWRAFVKNLN
jgi:hypothetical protein